MRKFLEMKKADIILCLGILVLVLVLYIFMNVSKDEGEIAVITVKGEKYAVCKLSEDKEIKITSDDGKENVVVVKDGYVYMKSANCPDKICVKHKKIKYQGEQIACVPNQIIIEIKSKETSNIDTVAR